LLGSLALSRAAPPHRPPTPPTQALLPEGCWLIGDMASLESPAANIADQPLAPLLYGFSCHM
jgi:hypothetical protein